MGKIQKIYSKHFNSPIYARIVENLTDETKQGEEILKTHNRPH